MFISHKKNRHWILKGIPILRDEKKKKKFLGMPLKNKYLIYLYLFFNKILFFIFQ
jgi:hypothetical protein